MKITNRVGVIWAISVFIVIGLVFILIAVLLGGDETDMEQQPEGAAAIRPAALGVGLGDGVGAAA